MLILQFTLKVSSKITTYRIHYLEQNDFKEKVLKQC